MEYSANEIIRLLGLQPLPGEGGFYRETYRSVGKFNGTDGVFPDDRHHATAIFYMVTPETFSTLHRLPGDEIFHFYLGDPVRMLMLHPNGSGEEVILGPDLSAGQRVQSLVPGGTWQGTRLLPGGRFALLGTTMSPGFDFRDYQAPDRQQLMIGYPAFSERIMEYC